MDFFSVYIHGRTCHLRFMIVPRIISPRGCSSTSEGSVTNGEVCQSIAVSRAQHSVTLGNSDNRCAGGGISVIGENAAQSLQLCDRSKYRGCLMIQLHLFISVPESLSGFPMYGFPRGLDSPCLRAIPISGVVSIETNSLGLWPNLTEIPKKRDHADLKIKLKFE